MGNVLRRSVVSVKHAKAGLNVYSASSTIGAADRL